MPKVTVAIPTYNRENYLRECLKSILQQSFHDFEVVIFDNRSDYDIKKLVEEFNDPRIQILINETNIGRVNNLNQVFQYKYKSSYVIIFHDDDTMHPNLLEKEVSLLDENKDVVFVITDLNSIERHDLMLKFPKVTKKHKVSIFSDYTDLVRLLLRHFGFCFDSIMYRTSTLVFSDLNDYGKTFFKWNDRPYFIDKAKNGSSAVIYEKLVNYRVHSGQDSQEEHADKFNYFLNLYNYYRECLPQPLSKSDKKLFYSWSTNNLILLCSSFATNFKEYFKVLKRSQENGLFKLWHLNIRGLYYALIVVRRMAKRKLREIKGLLKRKIET